MKTSSQGIILSILAATIVVLSPPYSLAQDKPKETVVLKRVPRVTDVTYELQTSDPPNLVVTAEGTVPTGSWTEVQLIRRVYEKEPADGIWEYDLLARPPAGPAAQVISKVKASDIWEKVDATKLKGLRVYGLEKGTKTLMFK